VKLTKEWLGEATTSGNLHKGEILFHAVNSLQKKNKKFTATVQEDTICEVEIEINELDIDCYCTCNYDFGGLCAHAVAVCLHILDQNFMEQEEPVEADLEENIAIRDYQLKDGKHFHKNIFLNSPKKLRAEFLQQIFENHEFLRKNFLHFLDTQEKYRATIDLESLRQSINEQLIAIDDSGSTGDDQLRNNSLDEFTPILVKITAILEKYGRKSMDYLEKKQYNNAFLVLLTLYEVSLDKPIEDRPDLEGELLSLCEEWKETFNKQIIDNPPGYREQETGLDLLTDKWQYYQKNHSRKPNTFNFKFFEPFFLALLSSESANYLYNLLFKDQSVHFQTAKVALRIAQLLKKQEWWVEIAENFAGNDPEIALQLMDYYHGENQQHHFYRIARYTYALFPDQLLSYLLKQVHPKTDQAFYIDLLKHHTYTQMDIEAYKELREYLSEEEKETFIQRLYPSSTFYVRVLAAELRFSEILVIARKQEQTRDFLELVRPIAQVYPHDVFELLTKRIIEQLTLYQLKPSHFSRLGRELLFLKEIRGTEEARDQFYRKLRKQFKGRTRFIEELDLIGI